MRNQMLEQWCEINIIIITFIFGGCIQSYCIWIIWLNKHIMALGCSRHVAQQSKNQISKRQAFSIPLGLRSQVVWLILIHFAYIYWATACQWLISLWCLWCLTNVSILTLREAKLHELDTLLLNVPARKLIGLLGCGGCAAGPCSNPSPYVFEFCWARESLDLRSGHTSEGAISKHLAWPAEVTQND